MFGNMRPLKVEDKSLFDSVYSRYEKLPSDLNFVKLWIWKGTYKILWSIINECLCVFAESDLLDYPGGMTMWGPPLPLDGSFRSGYSYTLDACFRILAEHNQHRAIDPRIFLVWDQILPFLIEAGYELYPTPKDADYVYQTQSLTSLSGKPFKQKRKELRKFENTYSFSVENYACDLRNECLDLHDFWLNEKVKSIKNQAYLEKLWAEAEATHNTLNWDSVLGIRGIVLRVSGKVKAFAIGCNHSVNSTLLLAERADVNFKGIYCKTLVEFCKRCVTTNFVNLESDWGVDYLRQSKLRWNPEEVLMTYYATKKSRQAVSETHNQEVS